MRIVERIAPTRETMRAVALALLCFASPLIAGHIELNLVFDLREGIATPTLVLTNQIPITPTTFATGDTYDISFSFARGEILRFDSASGADSVEKFSNVFSKSSGVGVGLALTNANLTLDVYNGNPSTGTGISINEDCLNCVEVSGAANFTDSTLSVRGGRFEGTVESLGNGPGTLDMSYLIAILGNPRILVAREFLFDLDTMTFFGAPNHLAFGDYAVEPFLIGEGDEFDFTVRFAGNRALQADGGQNLNERVSLAFLSAPGTSQPFGLALTEVETRLLGLSGQGTSGVFSTLNQDCLNCLEVGGEHNVSDGQFAFSGARFTGKVNQLTDTSLVSRASFQLNAGSPQNVENAEVPEPGSWTMLVFGLGALIAAGRMRLRQLPVPEDPALREGLE